jgi:hypothetical protein
VTIRSMTIIGSRTVEQCSHPSSKSRDQGVQGLPADPNMLGAAFDRVTGGVVYQNAFGFFHEASS